MSNRSRRSVLMALAAIPAVDLFWPRYAQSAGQPPAPQQPIVAPDPDRVGLSSLVLSPCIAYAGSSITVTATAYNTRDKPAANVPWDITAGSGPSLRGNVTIPAKSNATFSGTFSASGSTNIPVAATIDFGNTLAEPLAQRANNHVETNLVVMTGTQDQWSSWARAAAQEMHTLLEEATQVTNISWSSISGPSLAFKLQCSYGSKAAHIAALSGKGLPQQVAQAFVESVVKAYEAWIFGFQGLEPVAYSAFACFPAPLAPPTPNNPAVIGTIGNSAKGITEFSPPVLASSVKSRLGSRANEPGASTAVNAFCAAVSAQFAVLLATKLLANAFGSGPVPTFAPSIAGFACGAVVGGTVAPASRHLYY
jgi:hypothetical protein